MKCLLGLESGIEAYALAALTRILKMDPVDVENLSKDAWAAAKNRSSHMYTI